MRFIELCEKILRETEESYKGEHTAPDSESGVPLYNLESYYPNIYSSEGIRLYSSGYPSMDSQAIAIINHCKGKPNTKVAVYRAVPSHPITTEKKIQRYEEQKRHILKTGRIPKDIDNGSWGNASSYYEYISDQIEKLKSLPSTQEKDYDINSGDWIAITKEYAKQHGESNLNNKYKILKRTVPAKYIYNDGDSIQEWGYQPK